MPGASEDTKVSLAEVWKKLTRYPEVELIATLEEAGKEAMEENDDGKLDDVPLALYAQPPQDRWQT